MNEKPQVFLGIDVAKEKVDGFLLHGQQSSYRVFPNEPGGFEQLSNWLHQEQTQQVHACLEATGCYSDAIAHYLFEHGHIVSLLNPAILVDYRKSRNTRSKTDKLDAKLLAHYGQQLQPPAWHPLPENILALRSLLAYRDEVQLQLLQARNRQRTGLKDPWVARRVQAQVKRLATEMKQAETRIWATLERDKKLGKIWKHLQTIRGIGALSAAQLIAQIGELERFAHPGALVSLAGLAVKQRESGISLKRRGQMDRHGRRALRDVLYMCALVAMRWDSSMHCWAERLKARGKPTKVVLVAVMRKLLHIVYGVWKNDCDYDPHIAFPSFG